MTNDICLKGFWPPEAKLTVDFGNYNQLEKKLVLLYNHDLKEEKW